MENSPNRWINSNGKSIFTKWQTLTSGIGKFENNIKHLVACGAGRGLISVDVDGNLFVCHRFVGEKRYMLGDVYNGFDNEKRKQFLKDDNNNNNWCNMCWVRYLCSGGCYQNNYSHSGNIYNPDPKKCEFVKYIYELQMSIYGNKALAKVTYFHNNNNSLSIE